MGTGRGRRIVCKGICRLQKCLEKARNIYAPVFPGVCIPVTLAFNGIGCEGNFRIQKSEAVRARESELDRAQCLCKPRDEWQQSPVHDSILTVDGFCNGYGLFRPVS